MTEHQILPDGTAVTGSIEFDGAEVKNYDAVLPYETSVEIQEQSIETEYYRVEFERSSKKIKSIFCKETGMELLDQNAQFDLGQFIYLYTESKDRSEGNFEMARNIDLRVYDGKLAYVVVQNGYEEQSGAEVTAQFIFYKNEKNIDVDLSYKNASGLIGDFYDRYKKNYFFAFPFHVEHPHFYTESAVGEINEKNDRIEINAADFTVTQNWLAAEGKVNGVALYSEDMPVFYIGAIKYNRFQTSFDEDKAHYYLYASSNRTNNLIYQSIEDCHAEYRLSILPYSEKHNQVVPTWSYHKAHQPVIGKKVRQERTFCVLNTENIRMAAVKKAESCNDAIIMRFIETAGCETVGRIWLSFIPEHVRL